MNRAAAFAFALPLALLVSRTALADEPAPATIPAAPAPKPAEAGPVVELSANDGRATIERRVSTSSPGGVPIVETGLFSIGHWEHACVAPCQVKLDPRYAYRVAGDGLVPTDSFSVRSADRVRVDAKMGSSTGRVAGAVATGAGLLGILGGGLAVAATPVLESEDVGSKGFRSGVLAGGVSLLAVGVVTAGVGLYLWLSNGSSARTENVASR